MYANRNTRRDFLKTIGLGVASQTIGAHLFAIHANAAAGSRMNVLFIAVDDLRPQISCYGHRQMYSPNLDRLASEGVLFERCYCQVPVCGASRSSLLTGVRPTRDRFTSYNTVADDDLPGATSLPKLFREKGYHTVSNGKVYHHQNDGAGSWTEPAWRPSPAEDGNWRNYLKKENIQLAAGNQKGAGPPYEKIDVPDNAYFDGKIADKTIADLQRLKDSARPFFLAAGFLKPHLPFNAPAKYWDLYKRENIDLADNPFRPKGAPDAALHNWGELRAYETVPKEGPLPDEFARTMIHGYYACVSYTDAQIGKLMDELDRLDLRKNTVVVLWGDHGWNLGEHGLWCKHCNFETSLHSPLLISAPGVRGDKRVNSLTEFVDIYPTLSDLCGFSTPDHLEGSSLTTLIENPDAAWKNAVFSRFKNGDSVKTDRYRYTEWTRDNGDIYARMLYDHKNDPMENVNIAAQPEKRDLVDDMQRILHSGWKSALPG